jgi:hypothetical protein
VAPLFRRYGEVLRKLCSITTLLLHWSRSPETCGARGAGLSSVAAPFRSGHRDRTVECSRRWSFVVLKPEGLVLQTSHRAWPPEGRCI